MANKGWDLIRDNLDRYKKGDIEWTEDNGRTYRGPVKTLALTENSERLNVVFGWTAYMIGITGGGGGEWFVTPERQQLSISKGMLNSATEGRNRQIEFNAQGKVGTFYPGGQNLSIRRVKGFGPTSIS